MCVCVCVCVCNEVAWSEAQRQPSAGYSPSSFGGQSFTKKISLRLSSSGENKVQIIKGNQRKETLNAKLFAIKSYTVAHSVCVCVC